LKGSESLLAMVNEYREAATALPLSLEPMEPSPSIKSRLLESLAGPVKRSAPVFTRVFWAAAAVALFSVIVLSLRNAPETHLIEINGTQDAPAAHGMLRCTGESVDFAIAGLPTLPTGKCYQLWHIGSDKIAIPQRSFHADPSGAVQGTDRMRQRVGPNHLFAFTMEPEGGSKAPSLPIYAVAKY
jgi:anti-sigma-K factor RskA